MDLYTKGHPVSLYISSIYFEELQKNSTLEFPMGDPIYSFFLAEAKKSVKDYVGNRFYQDSVEEVKRIKQNESIYPYAGEASNKIDSVEREFFDLLAVEINNYVPSFRSASDETKQLTYRLIKEAVKTQRIIYLQF